MAVTALTHPTELPDPRLLIKLKVIWELKELVYSYPAVVVQELKEQIYSYFSPDVVQELEALKNETASAPRELRAKLYAANAIIDGICVFLIAQGGTAGEPMYGPAFAAFNQLRFRWFQEPDILKIAGDVCMRFIFEYKKLMAAKQQREKEGELVDRVLGEGTALCDDHILCNMRLLYIKKSNCPSHASHGLKLYDGVFNDSEQTKLTSIIRFLEESQSSVKVTTTNPGFKRHIQLGVPIFNYSTNAIPFPPLLQSTIQHLNQWKLIPNEPNTIIISYFSNEIDDVLIFDKVNTE